MKTFYLPKAKSSSVYYWPSDILSLFYNNFPTFMKHCKLHNLCWRQSNVSLWHGRVYRRIHAVCRYGPSYELVLRKGAFSQSKRVVKAKPCCLEHQRILPHNPKILKSPLETNIQSIITTCCKYLRVKIFIGKAVVDFACCIKFDHSLMWKLLKLFINLWLYLCLLVSQHWNLTSPILNKTA